MFLKRWRVYSMISSKQFKIRYAISVPFFEDSESFARIQSSDGRQQRALAESRKGFLQSSLYKYWKLL